MKGLSTLKLSSKSVGSIDVLLMDKKKAKELLTELGKW